MARAKLRLLGMMRLALVTAALALAAAAATEADAQPRKPAPARTRVVKKPTKRVRIVGRKKPVDEVTILDVCKVSSDCTIYFRLSSCFPGDPLAINGDNERAARAEYPVKREECAMGGPQYERQRRMNEQRWSTSCEHHRCVLHDHGLHDPLDDLRAP